MKKIFIILFLSTQYLIAFATDTLTVHENESKLLSRNYISQYNDPQGNLSIYDILKIHSFKQPDNVLPVLKYKNIGLWLKLVLKNKTTQPVVTITIGASVIDNFDLYTIDGSSQRIIHLAADTPRHSGLSHNITRINCIVLPDSVRTVYLQIKSHEAAVVPIYAHSANEFMADMGAQDLTIGAFIGIVLIMALYNLLLLFIVKDISYLYYVLYIIFLGLNQTLLRGYGTHFFNEDKTLINSVVIPLGRIFFWFSLITFVNRFLQLRQNLKEVARYYYLLYLINLLPLTAVLFQQIYLAYTLISVCALLTSVALLVMGVALYWRGYQPAKFFLLGWTLFFVSIVIVIGRNIGLVVYNTFTANAILFASSLGLILFSAALADKINFYRRQKNESQLAALTAAVENERLTTQQNILLEQKVNERTHELIESNRNLSVTIENLKTAQIQLVNNEKMASLGQLTAGIAHEINNPINFVSANVKPLRMDFIEIMGLIDLCNELERSNDTAAVIEKIRTCKQKIDLEFIKAEIFTLLDGIDEGAHRTSEIVQSLRTFSRMDDSTLRLADVNKSILSTLVILRSTVPHYITIRTELADLPAIHCFPGKINQVLINLLNNSIQGIKEKTEHHNEQIIIKTTNAEYYINIEITDTGAGMSKEIQQRIFEPFFTTKAVGEGTGLGLSIVFGIIEQHHGHIKVKSAPGEGTTFTITLPKRRD